MNKKVKTTEGKTKVEHNWKFWVKLKKKPEEKVGTKIR